MDLICCYRISRQSGKHLAAQYSWITLNIGRTLCFHYMCCIFSKWIVCCLRIWGQDSQSVGPYSRSGGFSIQSKFTL